MDYSQKLFISNCKSVTVLNEEHEISLVQHQETKQIFVKKILHVYNLKVYEYLYNNPIEGIPAIAAYHEEDNTLTVLEEYISGISLSEYIRTHTMNDEVIFHIMLDLCAVLKRLHAVQPPIIHRDIKPSNIIITSNNQLILLDFNAAKFQSVNSESDTVLLGTRGYAAPEQYGFGASTPQTDIYAAGVLLKELVFAATTAMGTGEPSRFQPIINTCTQLDPKNRFYSAAELENALLILQKEYGKKQYGKKPQKQAVSTRQQNNSLYHPLFPPGFRTFTPVHMVIGVLGYFLIFFFGITLEVDGGDGSLGWIVANKIVFIAICLSTVLISCNYLNVQRVFPLCNNKNRFISLVGVIVFDAFAAFVLLLILALLQKVFFPV